MVEWQEFAREKAPAIRWCVYLRGYSPRCILAHENRAKVVSTAQKL